MADGAGTAEPLSMLRGRRPARPIAVYLAILALVALIPAFIFSAILLDRNNDAQERNVETLIIGNARSMVQAVDREIIANISTVRVLATAPELVDSDLLALHRRVSTALAGSGSYVYVVNADYMSVMSTRQPVDEQRQVKVGDIDSAREAFESGNIVVSDVVLCRTAQQWVINILLRVGHPGMEPMLLGFSRGADQLSTALLSNKMPDGWNVALIDRKGAVVAASDGGGAVGEALVIGELDDRTSSDGWRSLEGNDGRYLLVTQQSLLTGWTLAAWADEDVVTRPLAEAFWTLIAGGVLLAAVVILVVYWVSLRIGRSVHGLQADAKRLGAGQPVEARPFPIAEIETVSAALGEASKRRQAAETEVRFLMRELAHRSKNQMTVISAMAKQTARGADSVPEFVSNFERRIFGLAKSTDLLLAYGVAGVDLKELLVGQIDPFCPVDGIRAVVDGPQLRLNAQAGQIVGMAAHELATNAVKHGAFAHAGGRLKVSWKRQGDAVQFTWRESGFATSAENQRRGFGTTVLENMVGRSLGADVERIVHDDGLEWRFSIPLVSLDPSNTLNGRGGTEAADADEAEK